MDESLSHYKGMGRGNKWERAMKVCFVLPVERAELADGGHVLGQAGQCSIVIGHNWGMVGGAAGPTVAANAQRWRVRLWCGWHWRCWDVGGRERKRVWGLFKSSTKVWWQPFPHFLLNIFEKPIITQQDKTWPLSQYTMGNISKSHLLHYNKCSMLLWSKTNH